MSTSQIKPKSEVTSKSLVIAQNVKPTEEAKKNAILATIEKFKPEPPKTAEERILRKDEFEALTKRYLHLKEKSNDLKMFEAGNDKTNAKITFENSQGYKFEIRNSNVIATIKKATAEELNILLEEAKNEVLTFEI